MEPVYASIARLVFRYADFLDTGDLEGMAGMFDRGTLRTQTPDGVYTFTGAAEVLGAFTGSVLRYENGTLGTRHVTTNLAVDEGDEPGMANARSYFTVLQARPDFPLQVVCAGGYTDRFVLDPEDGRGWRFDDRLIRIELVGDMSRHVAGL